MSVPDEHMVRREHDGATTTPEMRNLLVAARDLCRQFQDKANISGDEQLRRNYQRWLSQVGSALGESGSQLPAKRPNKRGLRLPLSKQQINQVMNDGYLLTMDEKRQIHQFFSSTKQFPNPTGTGYEVEFVFREFISREHDHWEFHQIVLCINYDTRGFVKKRKRGVLSNGPRLLFELLVNPTVGSKWDVSREYRMYHLVLMTSAKEPIENVHEERLFQIFYELSLLEEPVTRSYRCFLCDTLFRNKYYKHMGKDHQVCFTTLQKLLHCKDLFLAYRSDVAKGVLDFSNDVIGRIKEMYIVQPSTHQRHQEFTLSTQSSLRDSFASDCSSESSMEMDLDGTLSPSGIEQPNHSSMSILRFAALNQQKLKQESAYHRSPSGDLKAKSTSAVPMRSSGSSFRGLTMGTNINNKRMQFTDSSARKLSHSASIHSNYTLGEERRPGYPGYTRSRSHGDIDFENEQDSNTQKYLRVNALLN